MKAIQIMKLLAIVAMAYTNSVFAEPVNGSWTKVKTIYTYLQGGAFCGAEFSGMTLVELTANSSSYAAPCVADYAIVDGESIGGKAALSVVLSAQASGAEIKINVDTADSITCIADGKKYCKAVQVNVR
jgi:hypothetical protein